MKKILLVFIIFISGIFLYENIEIDLLSKEQKKILLKELNIANQLQQFKNEGISLENQKEINKLQEEPIIEGETSDALPDTSSNIISPNTSLDTSSESSLDTFSNMKVDVLELLQKVSFEDQLEVANILLKRFTFTELNEYRTMVGNGINGEEKEQIKQEVLSRLTEKDLISLKKIAEKYVVEYYPEQQERFNTLANRYLEEQ